MTSEAKARVGLFRGSAATPNFSMDAYAESMLAALRDECPEFDVEQVWPAGRARLPGGRYADRFSAFAERYPRYLLQARSTRFAVNHVMDHALGHLAYALDPARTIVSCHDIFPLKLRKGAIGGMERRKTPPVTVIASLSGLRRARMVVTSTEATKRDLASFVGVRPEKIRVVPYGLHAGYRQFGPCERADAERRFPLGGEGARHILAVDTGAGYKNQRATIEVLVRVRARMESDVRLVRVGPPLRETERARARRLRVADAIVELGSLPQEDMAAIYNRCDVLLFPSFYEGFGWPPLEAMACGVPVVASRAQAVTEVVSDAALTADAEDYDGLAVHVLMALADGLVSRALIERGSVRAAGFTWARAARDVSDLYRTIIELPPWHEVGTKGSRPCAA